jgi:hypothetical protein
VSSSHLDTLDSGMTSCRSLRLGPILSGPDLRPGFEPMESKDRDDVIPESKVSTWDLELPTQTNSAFEIPVYDVSLR